MTRRPAKAAELAFGQHRFEAVEREPLPWEQALFWICWACLGGLAVWLLGLLWAPH